MRRLSFTVLSLVLSSCMMGPDYKEPIMDIPETWANAMLSNQVVPRNIQNEITWWENYKDPLLNQIIKEALKSNYDLKTAFATICQARANLLGAEANLAPAIDGTGAFSHNEISRNTSGFFSQQNVLPVTPTGGGASSLLLSRYFNLYSTAFSTSWEIDVFGRIRRSIESAEASLEAQIDDMHNVLISLIANVAINYINLRSFQAQLEINQKTFKDWDAIYKLNQALLKAGLASDIDVGEAKSYRDQAEANIPPLNANIKIAIHQLSILVGKPPAYFYELLSVKKPIPFIPIEIFAGLPSELLKRRPDIRTAERNLASATAQIGVAEASLFPTFSFTGVIGYQSNLASSFITPGSGFYSFGPGFIWPIIDFGRVRAQIDASMAARDETLFQYKNTILNALADVENFLVNYAEEAKRYNSLTNAYKASKLAADVSLLRYESGLITYMTVLETEIAFLNVSLQQVQCQALLALNSVGLYKALGGGWQIDQIDWTKGQPSVLWPWTED